MSKEAVVTEITDDIEIIGPGQMLADARKNMGLSQEDVAKRLNFRLTLVKNIEEECFDHSLPATYNRGYLKSYAKLVNVSEADALSSFESLNVAKTQCAEMQSFSQQTKKQAHNNILMWITYLIIAGVIGSSAMWWLQGQQFASDALEDNTATDTKVATNEQSPSAPSNKETLPTAINTNQANTTPEIANANVAQVTNHVENTVDSPQLSADVVENTEQQTATLENDAIEQANNVSDMAVSATTSVAAIENSVEPSTLGKAVFNFSGDCWVNIYDATGERIAWGIKKANYEMNISGVAPLSITLGKPELVQITFNGQAVDMSNFGRGNIAKFTLPLEQASQ